MENFVAFLYKSPMNLVLFGTAVVTGGMLIWPFLSRLGKPGKQVDPLQAVQLINRRDAVLIDIRDAAEYGAGHIPNARHIPQGELQGRLKELEKFKARPLIVACNSGTRSHSAGTLLQKSGFGEVYSLQGGINAWRQANLPVEK